MADVPADSEDASVDLFVARERMVRRAVDALASALGVGDAHRDTNRIYACALLEHLNDMVTAHACAHGKGIRGGRKAGWRRVSHD